MGYQALLFCPDEKLARVVSQVFGELDFAVNSVLNRASLLDRELLDSMVQRALRLLQSERNEESKVRLASKLLRAVEHLPPDDPLVISVQQFAQPIRDAADEPHRAQIAEETR